MRTVLTPPRVRFVSTCPPKPAACESGTAGGTAGVCPELRDTLKHPEPTLPLSASLERAVD
eukprot:5904606-Prymnesium_polylepis.1